MRTRRVVRGPPDDRRSDKPPLKTELSTDKEESSVAVAPTEAHQELGTQQYHETGINDKATELGTCELGQQQYYETGTWLGLRQATQRELPEDIAHDGEQRGRPA